MMSDKVVVAARTHPGYARAENEDAVAVGGRMLKRASDAFFGSLDSDLPLVMIADGMGGHAHGSTASEIAIRCLIGEIPNEPSDLHIAQSMSVANDQLYRMMADRPELTGMGTTIVGALFLDSEILHFNVGDSRAYRHQKGRLRQLSYDDVPAKGGSARRSHAITQSIGGRTRWAAVAGHVGRDHALSQGDRLLLCSDGLTDMVQETDICDVLDSTERAEDAAGRLLKLALDAGGADNISVIIAQQA